MKPEDITAWALNELTPEECAEIEAALAADPTYQKQAGDAKAFCDLLSEHLVDDNAAFTAEQRERLQALDLTKVDNVVPFDAEADPARMNGRAFHAKVTAANEVRAPRLLSPWLAIATMAACLMLVLVVIDQTRKMPGSQAVTARTEVEGEKVNFPKAKLSPFAGSSSSDVAIKAEKAAAPVPEHFEPNDIILGGAHKASTTINQMVQDTTHRPIAPESPAPAKAKVRANEPLSRVAMNPPSGGLSPEINGTVTFGGATASSGVAQQTPNSFSGGVTVTKLGGGTVALRSNNSYTSTTTVNAGTLAVEGGELKSGSSLNRNDRISIASNAAVPASPGYVATGGKDYDPPQILQKIDDLKRAERAPTPGSERYAKVVENPFVTVQREPLSTFSIDVDTASYANVRRFLNAGRIPPPDAVRLEELINYFPYAYEKPDKDLPFSVQVDLAEAPWAPDHRLARVAIKGREVGDTRPSANFVFLVDVSGSMDSPERLPLVKLSLEMLTRQLRDDDHVSIVTYAGACRVALESTSGKEKSKIMDVIRSLNAGGSTNGESGITMAYEQASANFIKGGVNRVILCTDGDFNVGISDPHELEKLIKDKAKGGTFLSVLGFGTDNLQDRTMITLADHGNGNYAYIDSLGEARKVLVEQMQSTLVTIAKDVKIQVEFNPAQVASYRLIGYEKRMLAASDFNNDKKDAGEIGAGHTITALYEIVPVGVTLGNGALAAVDDLKYQPKRKEVSDLAAKAPQEKLALNDEMMTVKLRYKAPDGEVSRLIEHPVRDSKKTLNDSPGDFRFAAAVAGFGMLLRDSEHADGFGFEFVRRLALSGKGEDALGYRGEFIQLIDKAEGLKATRNR